MSDCSICLEKICENNTCTTKCGHKYHLTCIFKIKNNTCPICRGQFLEIETPQPQPQPISYIQFGSLAQSRQQLSQLRRYNTKITIIDKLSQNTMLNSIERKYISDNFTLCIENHDLFTRLCADKLSKFIVTLEFLNNKCFPNYIFPAQFNVSVKLMEFIDIHIQFIANITNKLLDSNFNLEYYLGWNFNRTNNSIGCRLLKETFDMYNVNIPSLSHFDDNTLDFIQRLATKYNINVN